VDMVLARGKRPSIPAVSGGTNRHGNCVDVHCCTIPGLPKMTEKGPTELPGLLLRPYEKLPSVECDTRLLVFFSSPQSGESSRRWGESSRSFGESSNRFSELPRRLGGLLESDRAL